MIGERKTLYKTKERKSYGYHIYQYSYPEL